jgi:hypothetical protein
MVNNKRAVSRICRRMFASTGIAWIISRYSRSVGLATRRVDAQTGRVPGTVWREDLRVGFGVDHMALREQLSPKNFGYK